MAKKSKKSKAKPEVVVETVEKEKVSNSSEKVTDDGKWKELGFKSLDHYTII